MKKALRRSATLILLLLYGAAWLAPFLSPYPPEKQFREAFLSPPSRIRFVDREGRWSWRPFVYAVERQEEPVVYRETSRKVFLQFLLEGSPYRWMGLSCRKHLFGLEDNREQFFLLGSDELGRDVFTRILYGSRFSLSIGLIAIVFTLTVGVVVGALAGYFSGWTDRLAMRLSDLFLSLPAFFLILGIRSVFPGQMESSQAYWLMVCIFTLLGWASVARVVRGQVLSQKTKDYVLAARALGAGHLHILVRHILPFTGNYLLVQSVILVPAFILGEITLSFLGVGVSEPDSSWGTLLVAAASVRNLTTHPWLLTPALFIVLLVLCFTVLGDFVKAFDRRQRLLT